MFSDRKNYFVSCMSLLVICFQCAVAAGANKVEADKKPADENIYEYIAKFYLPTKANDEAKELEKSKEYAKEFAEKAESSWLPDIRIEIFTLGDIEKLRHAYAIFGAQVAAQTQEEIHYRLDEQTLDDLEILSGQQSKLQRHLIALFEPYLHTAIGKVQLQKMLCQPQASIKTLCERQARIKLLCSNISKLELLNKRLASLTKAENEMLWFWKNVDKEVFGQFETAAVPTMFFNWPDFIKKRIEKSPALTEYVSRGCHLTGLIIPSTATLSALFFGEKIYQGTLVNYLRYLRLLSEAERSLMMNMMVLALFTPLLWYAYAINNMVYNEATNALHTKVNGVAQFTNVASQVLGKDAFGKDAKEVDELVQLLSTSTFKNDPSFFSYKGRAITAFTLMSELKNHFVTMLEKLGELDAYVAIASFMQAQKKNASGQYCFPAYVEKDTPYLNLTNYWHPFLNPATVVTNDIELGGNVTRNIVVTGPNAGGKSTSLKSITMAVIMAQTLGIAPASSMTLTPFKIVNTYMNVADNAGSESLFQAEMHRAGKLIESVRSQKGKDFIFVVMDELFTGTNPLEGAAAAYGVIRKLVSYQNCMLIFVTHFKELTELEQETGGMIKNFKVWVERQTPDEQSKIAHIVYPYKLAPGISNQTIALDLLAQEGFDSEILNHSNAQLERLKQAKAKGK